MGSFGGMSGSVRLQIDTCALNNIKMVFKCKHIQIDQTLI